MSDTVNVAIIGVGNCASSLVQGVEFYKDAKEDEFVPGLMHVNLGGYHVRDIKFTAAINITKVGQDLSAAVFAEPNNTIKISDVPHLGVEVHRGMTHDGLGKYLSEVITKAPWRDGRHRRHPARHQHPRGRELPAGGLRERHQVVRRRSCGRAAGS